jgi:hypothetical protein
MGGGESKTRISNHHLLNSLCVASIQRNDGSKGNAELGNSTAICVRLSVFRQNP